MVSTICLWSVLAAAGDAGELRVLTEAPGETPPQLMLHTYLMEQARAAVERRRRQYEEIKTAEQARQWQAERREFFLRQLDGLPARPPVAAQTAGQLRGEGCRVEKIIYETRPQHHAAALLYLPNGKPPFPAVLIACGHSDNGKAFEPYQRVGVLLAKNGLAAMCYDPIGQGERSQILSPDNKRIYNCVYEHTLIDIGCILLGANTARYRIFDGMQTVDYLRSRPDIDPQRIGCAGNSGGGTETSYLMALDDRIVAAAPGCYLTSFGRLLETLGPQDGEQNIAGQLAFGMDHADYLLMRAPQPTLICSATHDSFDITGTWDTFRQAKRFYARLGYPERADLIEIDERHGFTTHLREATARWMCRWLSGRDRPIVEEAFPIFTEEQVRCTPDGQVLRLSGEKSVFQFNWERQSGMAAQRRRLWRDNPAASMLERVREVVGVRRLADLPEPKHRSLGTLQRQGCRIEKLLLTPEPGIVLPGLAFFPAQPDGQACLYLHGQGKHADAGPGGPIENLLAKRMTVLAVDLRGVGETESRHTGEWPRPVFGPNGREFFLAYLLGRSLVGMMTEDALVCARFLAHWPAAGSPRKVHLVAVGKTGVPALHAAALEPELFASLSLTRTLESWSDVVATPVAKDHLVDAVHGALKVYDLPDLVHSLPEGFATIREPLRADGSPR